MLIGICGIKRSGSTAQFNMFRLILETKYNDINLTGDVRQIDYKTNNIVKLHVYSAELYSKSDFLFTTDRDRVEIMESLERFNTGEIKPMSRMVRDLELYKRKSLHQEFTDIVNNPKMCIKQIANHLGIDVDVEDIFSKFKAIKPEEEYNPKTMLFPNHITK
jgi:hypothetical protein